MVDNPLVRLNQMGQSVWYDNIRRSLLLSGELEQMVQAGEVRGVTSNPSIFENAIGRTEEYNDALRSLSAKGRNVEQAYEILAVEDVRAAADILRPVHDKTDGLDGFVSLEVTPALAEDSATTLKEAVRLWKIIGRPNLMIKIPGTLAGLESVRKAIAEGINVNVTLLFSVERYRLVMDAYISGLEDRLARGFPLSDVNSVASFFVSRLDTLVDKRLDQIIAAGGPQGKKAGRLRGQAAIANSRLAYQVFLPYFKSDRFSRLAEHGARIQRPLWASTSTKDPAYPDTYYVEALIARESVNTMPPITVDAYRDHGNPSIRIEDDLERARSVSRELASLGISLEEATAQLENEGVEAFQRSFDTMLEAIRNKMAPLS